MALARMEEAANVDALARELGIRRELLYVWRGKFLAGGAEALRGTGRPRPTAHPVETAAAPAVSHGLALDGVETMAPRRTARPIQTAAARAGAWILTHHPHKAASTNRQLPQCHRMMHRLCS